MYQYIVGAMLVAGVVGGLINSFLSDPTVDKPMSWWKHVVVGVGAAFLVPVFLNMISSHLVSEIAGTDVTPEVLSKLLVLGGFCLLAAISSRAFIRSMTDRFLQELKMASKDAKEAKELAANAENIAELSVEPESAEQPVSSTDDLQANATQPTAVSDIELKILRSMIDQKFSMRSLTGIAKDAGLPLSLVNQTLGPMLDRALIGEGKNKDGRPRWYPTPQGRRAVRENEKAQLDSRSDLN